MKFALISAIFLLVAVNVLLGLPKAVDLIQTKAIFSDIPNNAVAASGSAAVAGAEKVILSPRDNGIPPPVFSAAAILVKDMASDSVIFEKDSNKRLPIASTTKIMTALVAVEYFKPGDILTVPDNITAISGSTMGLKIGEKIIFRSILFGLLLNSGNDAAYAIAANYPGGVDIFIERMNQKAKEMGLLDSHFDNPAGFDSPNHFSSAADLAKIAAIASSNIQISKIVGTRETTVASQDQNIIHPLKNLNKLLDMPGALGMKTGTTPAARENLVGLLERDGHIILTVMLGSDDRFGETQKLIDWVFSNFSWPNP